MLRSQLFNLILTLSQYVVVVVIVVRSKWVDFKTHHHLE